MVVENIQNYAPYSKLYVEMIAVDSYETASMIMPSVIDNCYHILILNNK